ncbi:MAG: ABC transporter ATP-binding protein [Rubrivivax sp.]|nr:ABC transporter ATP-binding protein [Rubrivivax sp.]
MSAVVTVSDLVVSYRMEAGDVFAVDGVDLTIAPGERVGIVGESGSGKSTLGMAIGRLLAPNARFVRGDIRIGGQAILSCTATELRQVRRDRLGFVYQNPMSALDPTMRVGGQVALAIGGRPGMADIEALLGRVGLPDPARAAGSFPHELSGGMAQRVVIALAIARNPAVLIADEPTASLDASIQGVILDLLASLRDSTGASLVILSHDLRMVANRCDRLLVMYGGRVIESGPSRRVFRDPRHPYTRALIKAAAGNEGPDGVLEPIPGVPPVLRSESRNCAFAERCEFAQARCRQERPAAQDVDGCVVTCHFAAEGLVRTRPSSVTLA